MESLRKSNLDSQSQKLFRSILWFCFKIKFLKIFFSIFAFAHIHKTSFILSILFQSHLIKHSGTQSAFRDAQGTLEHSRHSESTRVLGGHSGTWTFKVLDLFSSCKALRHLDTQRARRGRPGKALGHSDTWALEELYLADSAFSVRIRALLSIFKKG